MFDLAAQISLNNAKIDSNDPLKHWGRDKMDAISLTTFSSAFYWMEMYESRLKITEGCSYGSN